MKKLMVVMHMSGAYAEQTFYKEKKEGWQICQITCQDIEGTNCYCDDAAKESLRERVRPYSYEGIHFLDSGNYHYLSLLWLEKIKEPFSLILFDHHPDLQAPSWGGITSCGGWVREALLTNEKLQRVYLVGVDAHLIEDVRAEDEASNKAGVQMSDATGNTISAKKLWEKIRIGINAVLIRKNGEVRSHRHSGRGDKRLFRVAVLRDCHCFSERSRTASLLSEIRERRRRNIFKFGADSGADRGNFIQSLAVFIASLNAAGRNLSRGADFTRIQNENVVTETRSGRTEHAAELTAAHHP